MPLPPRAIAALCAVADRLAAARVEWVLAGSAGRALAGHAARPRDIDLEVAEADAGARPPRLGAGAPARESGAGRTSLRVHATLAGMEVDVSAGLAVEGPGGRLERRLRAAARVGPPRRVGRAADRAGAGGGVTGAGARAGRLARPGEDRARGRRGGARAARGLRVGAPGLGGRERRAIGAVPRATPRAAARSAARAAPSPASSIRATAAASRSSPSSAGAADRGQHDHDLAPGRPGDSLGQLGERAAQHLLVELGQLPAHGRLALRPGLGQLGQQRGQPVGALEEDRGPSSEASRSTRARRSPAARGTKPVNAKPPRRPAPRPPAPT